MVLQTSSRLCAMGHPARIFSSDALDVKGEASLSGVPIRRFKSFYPYFGLTPEARHQMDEKAGNLFSFSLLKALRSAPDVDLIHLHTGNRMGGIGRHAAKIRRIPYVITLHGGVLDVPAEEVRRWTAPARGTFEWGKWLGWWVGSRRVLDDAAAILCVGESERRLMAQKFPSKRVEHLPNGVDAARFAHGDRGAFRARHRIPADAFVILIPARIDPQKNQVFAARLLSRMRAIRPDVHLVLAGPCTDQDYARQLEDQIQRSGLAAHITRTGGLSGTGQELVDAYHAADLLLLPSLHEPFGVVILEAWASGLPVVASRVGGIPSFVEDGRDGLLFAPDDERSCLEAFQKIIMATGLRTALASNGRKKAVESYSWDTVTRRLLKIYEEVIRENPVR